MRNPLEVKYWKIGGWLVEFGTYEEFSNLIDWLSRNQINDYTITKRTLGKGKNRLFFGHIGFNRKKDALMFKMIYNS